MQCDPPVSAAVLVVAGATAVAAGTVQLDEAVVRVIVPACVGPRHAFQARGYKGNEAVTW